MKILIDGRLYGLENTGLGRYVMNLVEGLSIIDKDNKYVILLRKKYFDSLTLPDNWKKVLADWRHYSFAEQVKIPGIIEKENPDVTHFPHFNVPLFFKGKYVVTIHDILMHKSVGLSATTLSPIQYFIKRLGYRLVFDNALRKSFRIIVPSIAIKNEMLREYKMSSDKIVVTYEGFDKKISKSKSSGINKPYFIYIGNAYPHKNLGNLIKAVNILNTKYIQNAILVISGARNIFTQRIEKMIRLEKAEDFVKLMGFIPDDRLGSVLEGSAAFAFPTLSEGFGLPGLEAMAAGTLVIASNIPVLKEVYKNNAIYFDPNNPNDIAKTMNLILNISEKERIKRVKKAKEFVKIYSWDKMAKETLRIYAESCNSLRQGK